MPAAGGLDVAIGTVGGWLGLLGRPEDGDAAGGGWIPTVGVSLALTLSPIPPSPSSLIIGCPLEPTSESGGSLSASWAPFDGDGHSTPAPMVESASGEECTRAGPHAEPARWGGVGMSPVFAPPGTEAETGVGCAVAWCSHILGTPPTSTQRVLLSLLKMPACVC